MYKEMGVTIVCEFSNAASAKIVVCDDKRVSSKRAKSKLSVLELVVAWGLGVLTLREWNSWGGGVVGRVERMGRCWGRNGV